MLITRSTTGNSVTARPTWVTPATWVSRSMSSNISATSASRPTTPTPIHRLPPQRHSIRARVVRSNASRSTRPAPLWDKHLTSPTSRSSIRMPRRAGTPNSPSPTPVRRWPSCRTITRPTTGTVPFSRSMPRSRKSWVSSRFTPRRPICSTPITNATSRLPMPITTTSRRRARTEPLFGITTPA